ncbi:MAG: SIS domain-containing protein [Verrucomicrobiae bacterium]|nr:SIS domain-containing protein [Verrucomicrobiae bacterium]
MNIDKTIDESIAAIASLRELKPQIEAAVALMTDALRSGGKILACGNGGSAADGAHFTTEFLCRFVDNRRALPAISLTCDGSFLTATANDFGYDYVFARQIEGLGKKDDVLVAITTSGNSPNVKRALEAARECGMKSVALLGRDGGATAGIADVEIMVPGSATARIQEAHKVVIHLLCGGVEEQLFPELYLDHC